jgi:hypothetical protein
VLARKSQGAAERKAGLKAIAQTGRPACVLPTKAPVPDRSTLRPDPDRAFNEHFMPRNAAVPVAGDEVPVFDEEASSAFAPPARRLGSPPEARPPARYQSTNRDNLTRVAAET